MTAHISSARLLEAGPSLERIVRRCRIGWRFINNMIIRNTPSLSAATYSFTVIIPASMTRPQHPMALSIRRPPGAAAAHTSTFLPEVHGTCGLSADEGRVPTAGHTCTAPRTRGAMMVLAPGIYHHQVHTRRCPIILSPTKREIQLLCMERSPETGRPWHCGYLWKVLRAQEENDHMC